MSKKNKFDNVFDAKEKIELTEEQYPNIIPVLEPKLMKESKKTIYINANFSEEIIEVGYVFLANGEQNVVSISNGKINMMQGRQYYIPVDNTVDSDDYNIKVHSDAADRFDVRFVKDGLAAIVPIRHNALLKTGERLCILTPLI
jgi:hypothetical protein